MVAINPQGDATRLCLWLMSPGAPSGPKGPKLGGEAGLRGDTGDMGVVKMGSDLGFTLWQNDF